MTKKEECFKVFSENLGATREQAIKLVVNSVGVTKTTAQTYYPAWRKELMDKPGYTKPEKKGIQENIKNITKNTKIITDKINKFAEIAEKSQIVEKDELKTLGLIEIEKEPKNSDIKVDKIVSDAFAKGKEVFKQNTEKIFIEAKEHSAQITEKLIDSVKQIITDNPDAEGIKLKGDKLKPIEVEKEDVLITNLVPVVMQGKYGRYTFDKDGVKAYLFEELISKEKVEEAREALSIWERCYGKEGTQVC